MGKDTPQPPAAPDPADLVTAQAQANRIDQVTPFGKLLFSGKNRNRATLTLSSDLENLLKDRTRLSRALVSDARVRQGLLPNELTPRDIDESGFVGLPGSREELDQFGADARTATFERLTGLLDPEFERQERAIRQRLADQGLPIGSEAEADVLSQFEQRRQQARQQAASEAVLAGERSAAQQLQNLTGVRNQQIADALRGIELQRTGRTADINELAVLLGLDQVQAPQLSGFFAPSSVDVIGANQLSQNAQLAQFQAQQQQRSDMLSGLFGLGSAFLLA